jgi:hypothetical protein
MYISNTIQLGYSFVKQGRKKEVWQDMIYVNKQKGFVFVYILEELKTRKNGCLKFLKEFGSPWILIEGICYICIYWIEDNEKKEDKVGEIKD